MKATEIYSRTTDKIVAQLEAGARGEDWSAPWNCVSSLPRNASTGRTYRGGNVVALWIAEIDNDYASSVWATYKQWEALGAQVRKGERATHLVKWVESKRTREAKANARDGEHVRSQLIPVGFAVFNVAQVDGYDVPETTTSIDPIDAAEHFYAQIPATVKHHSRPEAYYNRTTDTIHVPALKHYDDAAAYYAVRGHETVHWTGAADRLDRTKGATFGDNDYAREELVAEIGAAFIGAALGIETEPREDHAQYLANWIAVLRADDAALFHAAQAAQRAVDYLAAFVATDDETEEEVA